MHERKDFGSTSIYASWQYFVQIYREESQKKDTADETYMVETAVCPM